MSEPRLVHGRMRHIGGPFDLRVINDGQDVTIQPTDAELWNLAENIMAYLAAQAIDGRE